MHNTINHAILVHGNNQLGQLGTGDFTKREIPTKVELAPGYSVRKVACGFAHTIVMVAEEKCCYSHRHHHQSDLNQAIEQPCSFALMGCGTNCCSQLAQPGSAFNDTEIPHLSPIQNSKCLQEMRSIHCGCNFTMICSKDGKSLHAMGDNANGQIGLRNWLEVSMPNSVPLKSLRNNLTNEFDTILKVFCGYDHTSVLCESGSVYSTGKNNFRELGFSNSAIQNDSQYTLTRVACLDTILQPTERVEMIAYGENHSLLLIRNGESNTDRLLACGDNKYGACGLGTSVHLVPSFTQVDIGNQQTVQQISKIACGEFHSAVLTERGDVWVTGRNSEGQLSFGNLDHRYRFTKIDVFGLAISDISLGNSHSIFISALNRQLMFGTGGGFDHPISQKSRLQRIEFGKENNYMLVNSAACGGLHTVFYRDQDVEDGISSQLMKRKVLSCSKGNLLVDIAIHATI
ncbi:hypothetical protein C9374_007303 [Naegleria lovaniensis]|uniref:RCC1-like domain-containing protein n=1 Tax=Naegleria lovaniensis TaxID=51637 RepID=A0AA88KS29_NAELO|nr:uncharacterized protein C9374_007303 [Naegleria lovaniensis]KAG2393772.1 hypothetical protein C9374_007303 [Naegleria lovaniensis]